MALNLIKIEFPFSLIAIYQVWFWKRRFNIILQFCYYSLLVKGDLLHNHLNKIDFPSPMDVLCQVWLKSVQWSQPERERERERETDRQTCNKTIKIDEAPSLTSKSSGCFPTAELWPAPPAQTSWERPCRSVGSRICTNIHHNHAIQFMLFTYKLIHLVYLNKTHK